MTSIPRSSERPPRISLRFSIGASLLLVVLFAEAAFASIRQLG